MSETYPDDTETINQDVRGRLEQLLSQHPHSVKANVAREALDYHCPVAFFKDLLQHGCVSGMVSGMIYYTDTHSFFDKHYAAIETIREEVEENLGEKLSLNGDLKNALAWFAFEETAYRTALEIGIIE